jgi:hypothetical protein
MALSDEQIIDIYLEHYTDIGNMAPTHILPLAREVERAAREQVIDELRDIENDDPGRPLIDAIRALREEGS